MNVEREVEQDLSLSHIQTPSCAICGVKANCHVLS
jgi:hypothetical protein